RRLRHLDAGPRRHAEERQHDEDQRGDDGPHDLQRRVAVRVPRAAAGPVAVHDEEHDHRHEDQDAGDGRDRVDEMEQPIDVPAERRDVLGQPPVEHAGLSASPAGYFFTISIVTFVVAPGLTSTSFMALPSVSCQTSMVCLPAGAFSILATPFASVTPKNGCGITATQPSIQLCTSQVTLTNSGFSNFS